MTFLKKYKKRVLYGQNPLYSILRNYFRFAEDTIHLKRFNSCL